MQDGGGDFIEGDNNGRIFVGGISLQGGDVAP